MLAPPTRRDKRRRPLGARPRSALAPDPHSSGYSPESIVHLHCSASSILSENSSTHVVNSSTQVLKSQRNRQGGVDAEWSRVVDAISFGLSSNFLRGMDLGFRVRRFGSRTGFPAY